MSVEQADVVDGMGMSKDGENAVLVISDHLPWDEPGHLDQLAAKIGAYTNFILGGGVIEALPEAKGKPAVIQIVHQFDPSVSAGNFLGSVQRQLKSVGIDLTLGSLPAGY